MQVRKQNRIDWIKAYAANSCVCLRKAFYRKAPKIAEAFRALDKPMGPRTVLKMTEASPDVKRRNILENACLLLGACYLDDRKTFESAWLYLETFAAGLREPLRSYQSLDQAFVELKYAYTVCERAYYHGEEEKMPAALIGVDESVKGVAAYFNLRP